MTYYNIPPSNSGSVGAVQSVFGRDGDVTAQAGDYNTDLVSESATKKYYRPLYSEQNLLAGQNTSFPISESLNGWYFCSADISIIDGNNLINYSLDIVNLSTGSEIISTYCYANEGDFVNVDDFTVSIVSSTLNLNVQTHGSSEPLVLRLGNVLIF